METEDEGARDDLACDDRAQVRWPALSRPMEQADQSGGHNVKSVNQLEQFASSSVKRDAQQNFSMRMSKESN